MSRLKEVPNVAELYYICVRTRRGAKTCRDASIIRGVLHQKSRLEEAPVLRGAVRDASAQMRTTSGVKARRGAKARGDARATTGDQARRSVKNAW
jgi:hypothetical protein